MAIRPRTGRPLLDWFRHGLALRPDGTALRVGPHRLSYQELDTRARRLAGAILEVRPEPTRIGLLTTRGVAGYTCFLAARYAGATAVPLNTDFPPERTRSMLDAAEVSLLLVDDVGATALPDVADALDGVPVVPAAAEGARPVHGPCPVDSRQPAYIMFTSGSTGRPKGVPVTHANASHYLEIRAGC